MRCFMTEEVFAQYEDTGGNFHWHGTETGEHIIRNATDISNAVFQGKCMYCGWFYNFKCRAEKCISNVTNK